MAEQQAHRGRNHAGHKDRDVPTPARRSAHVRLGATKDDAVTQLLEVRSRVTADLRAMRVDPMTVEDIWQETALRFLAAADVRDPVGWCRVVARRFALKALRQPATLDLPERPTLRSAEEEAADRRAVRAALTALTQLDSTDRAAITSAITGSDRGPAPAASRMRLSRARSRLIHRMEGMVAGVVWRLRSLGIDTGAAVATGALALGAVTALAPHNDESSATVSAAAAAALPAARPGAAVAGGEVPSSVPGGTTAALPVPAPVDRTADDRVYRPHHITGPTFDLGERHGRGAEVAADQRDEGEGHRLCQAGVPLMEPGCIDLPGLPE